MADKIRFGLLGASQIARNAHIGAFENASNAVVHGIASRRASKAAEWAKEFNIPKVYQSYEEMLADPEIDAVLNTLPFNLHAEWTIEAAEAGKPTLCEKPLTESEADAIAMVKAVRDNNVIFMEAFSHHFSGGLERLQRYISDGLIGEVKIIRAEVIYQITNWEGDTRANSDLGASVVVEAGCYAVNTIRTLMDDEPESVTGQAGIKKNPGPFDSSFVGTMKFPDERLGFFTTTMETPFRSCCEVLGTEGRIYMPDLFNGSRFIVMNGDGEKEETFEFPNRFQAQIEHFTDCVLHKKEPRITPEDSARNMKVLDDLKKAAGC